MIFVFVDYSLYSEIYIPDSKFYYLSSTLAPAVSNFFLISSPLPSFREFYFFIAR